MSERNTDEQRITSAVLRWPEVHRRTGRSRTQVWRDVRAGKFPAPIQLGGSGGNSIGWLEHEVEAWLSSRPRVSWAGAAA